MTGRIRVRTRWLPADFGSARRADRVREGLVVDSDWPGEGDVVDHLARAIAGYPSDAELIVEIRAAEEPDVPRREWATWPLGIFNPEARPQPDETTAIATAAADPHGRTGVASRDVLVIDGREFATAWQLVPRPVAAVR